MKLYVGLLAGLSLVTASFANANAARSANVERASYHKSIKAASSAVVSLYASKNVATLQDNVDAAMYGNVMADDFNRNTASAVKLKEERSLGSGVIVDSKGLIVTNSHIVSQAQDIKVVTSNNNTYSAYVVGVDDLLDLAVLRLENPNQDRFDVITFADSDDVYVGDVVFALGNPFGIGQSASMGIVSAIGRSTFDMESAQYLIQTDAAINPGNSGGALINVDGKLVGINSAIFSKTEAFSGVGFSVPSNAVKFVVDTLQMNGSIQRAWLGARGEDVSVTLKNRLKLNSTKGVYVTNVTSGSPAALAGIQAGDVLIKLHNANIDNNNSYKAMVTTLPVDKKIRAKVIRNGRVMDLEVVLKAIEKRADNGKFMIRGNNRLSGIVVEQLSAELNHMLGLSLDSKGLAIIERPQAVAMHNIQVGDVILQVNKTTITDVTSLQTVLSSPAPFGLKLKILRAGRQLTIFIK